MPEVTKEMHKDGDFFVNYEEKVFEDVKADEGEKALVTFHTVAFEGSIGLVNILNAIRLNRKGYETSILLYGPGVTLGIQRGFPTLGDEAFPGHQNFAVNLKKFMGEGGKVYACRFPVWPWRAFASARHHAHRAARRAGLHPAAQKSERGDPRHLDRLIREPAKGPRPLCPC